ncbi:MAG: c-type cytochrome [Polyangiaceae bacterium]
MQFLGPRRAIVVLSVPLLGAALVPACTEDPIVPDPPPSGAVAVQASPQKPGDPTKGYHDLLNAPYVSCGVPASLVVGSVGAALPVLGFPPDVVTVPDRDPKNQSLPYFLTQVTAKNGVELVSTNCLSCHASTFDADPNVPAGERGPLVIGLGNANLDTTTDVGEVADLIDGLVKDPAEREAFAEWRDRIKLIAPAVSVDTVGLGAIDNLAVELFGRRDPATLEWKGEYQVPIPADVVPVPVAVPPWWRMKKKFAMFTTGSFQGEHARFMYAASSLCIDDVADALEIDAYFNDVRAYIESLAPPKYPGPIDAEKAELGKAIFDKRCAGCHGTYGEGATYPNLIIPVSDVGTDPALNHLANEMIVAIGPWLAKTYYAETNTLAETPGYVAPPLDGVWITAPYLHNDSVPTMELLLDSKKRPTYFTRSYNAIDYDLAQLGYPYTVNDTGKIPGDATVPNRQKYDTTRPGYGNQGHTYGDSLTDEERAQVIEYLKTI